MIYFLAFGIALFITHGYELLDDKTRTNEEAEAACQTAFGTGLASVHSAEDQAAISTLRVGLNFDSWIGLHRSATNKAVWEWSDGSAVDYANDFSGGVFPWATYEPNDYENNEGCVEVWATGRWNDVACDSDNYAICNSPNWSMVGDARWIIGKEGSSCDITCATVDAICDADTQSTITSPELVTSAFAGAGYTCNSALDENHRSYAGAPYRTRGGDCYYLSPGGSSVCDVIKYGSLSPLCYCRRMTETITIGVKACDGWAHKSYSSALQLQIRGANGQTEFFVVNGKSALPIDGERADFVMSSDSIEGIGQIYGVQIVIEDDDGYCIAGLDISTGIAAADAAFDSAQFGNGIILRPQCQNSFIGVSNDLPLLPCFESKIDLLANSPRGIYNLGLHSCNMDNAGLSVKNMQNSLYTSIQGTSPSGSSYIASGIQYLDHFTSTGLNWDSLGKITATNWKVSVGKGDFYTKYKTDKSLIGFKFEAVDWNAYQLEESDFSSLRLTVKTSQIDDKTYAPNSDLIRVVEDGRYVIVGFGRGIAVTPDSVLILSSIKYQYAMNVHLIAADDWEDYDLPFISYTATTLPQSASYSASEQYCEDTYGTSLLSIHSEEQNFLMFLFQSTWPYEWFWIGLNDRQNEGTFEWTDQSAFDYNNLGDYEFEYDEFRDCVLSNGKSSNWGTGDCSATDKRYPLCTNPAWSKDETRTFQINTDKYMEEVVSVTIGNNNKDSICFDEVIVNGEISSYLSTNWISSAAGTDNIMSAIFKYPVCDSEVIDFRLVPDTATIDISQGNVVQMSCSNRNRLISTQCGVSQSYETTTTTSYSFGTGTGKSQGRSEEYNWGSSSSVAMGTEASQSTTTSDEFSFGTSQEVGVSAEAGGQIGPVAVKATASVKVTTDQRWTHKEEKTKSTSISQTSTKESSQGGSDTTSNEISTSTSQDKTYETSETFGVSCEASTDIPPGHRMDYSLIFTQKNTTIKTYTDMKLTLCSAFLNPAHPDDPQNFIYLDNIEGVLNKQETTTCNVDFSPAETLRNDISCIEEQRMAISSGAYYIPTCKEDEPSQYTPCQCESVHAHLANVCYCVDKLGNIKENRMKEQILENTLEEICSLLQCEADEEDDEFGFNAADADQNGLLSFEEMIGMDDVEPEDIPRLEKIFDEIDANNDGAISADEMRIYAEANPDEE